MIKIGVLELQGNFESHHKILKKLGYDSVGVKSSSDLDCLDGLVLPGGESTTMSLLIDSFNLRDSLLDFSKNKPILGTCAGLIMMSNKAKDRRIKTLGLLDVDVERNASGRQIHSFCELLNVDINSKSQPIDATFIRAPKIVRYGRNVNVLATFSGSPCAVQSGLHLGLSFHPELNGVTIFHEFVFKKPVVLKEERIHAA